MTTGRINQVTAFPEIRSWLLNHQRPPSGSVCYKSKGIVGKRYFNKRNECSIGRPGFSHEIEREMERESHSRPYWIHIASMPF